MNDFESADGRYIVGPDGRPDRGTFPRSWGSPPADLEQRAQWIKARIREGEERLNRGEVVESQTPKTGRQTMAALRRRSVSPEVVFEVNRLRLRLLDLRDRS
jgi:hypothetical protein